MFPLFFLANEIKNQEEIRVDTEIVQLRDEVRMLKRELAEMKQQMYISRSFFTGSYGSYTCKLSLREAVNQLVEHAGLELKGSHAKEATAFLTRPRTTVQKLCKFLRGGKYER